MVLLILGHIVHTISLNEFEAIENGFVAVNADGKIIGVGNDFNTWRKQNEELIITKEIRLGSEMFLMPGFVDCHIHASQVIQIGLGLDMSLLNWLTTYTFPLEARYRDQEFARNVYSKVVEATISHGTTLACYFGTNDKDSTVILAKEAIRQGQRALVGKVCSDCNIPDYYVETTAESIANTEEFVNDVKGLKSNLVQPVITPRFALSCTKELMSTLGKIAKKHNLHIQSHISENIAEIEFVKELYGSLYAKVYEDTGLLSAKTVLAHGVHLEDEEIKILRRSGTSIAHCPASNIMLSSGICDVLRLIEGGVKVGLGTDVSGGNSISIHDTMLRALEVSHMLEFIKKQQIKGTANAGSPDAKYIPLNYQQAFYLATLGGAEALSMDSVTGNFVEGKDFDALIIDAAVYPPVDMVEGRKMDSTPRSKLLELVQRFVHAGSERNIEKVFVAGRQIK